MQVFKIDWKVYLGSEIKSFLLTGVFSLILLVIFELFTSLKWGQILILLFFLLVISVRDSVIPYRVQEIIVDYRKSRVIFNLRSFLLGRGQRIYDLKEVGAEIVLQKGINKLLTSSVAIRILLPKNQCFFINGRYGFSSDTLKAICGIINLSKKL